VNVSKLERLERVFHNDSKLPLRCQALRSQAAQSKCGVVLTHRTCRMLRQSGAGVIEASKTLYFLGVSHQYLEFFWSAVMVSYATLFFSQVR
jgi:hypothetical protein